MPRPRKNDKIDTNTYCGRFAARLRMLREKEGLTVEELAEKTGIPMITLYTWECGRRTPVKEEFPALAEALNVNVRNLLPKE